MNAKTMKKYGKGVKNRIAACKVALEGLREAITEEMRNLSMAHGLLVTGRTPAPAVVVVVVVVAAAVVALVVDVVVVVST